MQYIKAYNLRSKSDASVSSDVEDLSERLILAKETLGKRNLIRKCVAEILKRPDESLRIGCIFSLIQLFSILMMLWYCR
jgi:hypothetical protein